MCYHYGLAKDKAALESRYKANAAKSLKIPFVRVGAFDAIAQHLPAITNALPHQIQAMYWGLVPHWSPSGTIGFHTYNAVAETAHEKPTFKHALGKQHCLIPTDGFYEWQHQGIKKIPHFIWLDGHAIFSFAGLWDTWKDPKTGVVKCSFTILTTAANPLMASIHNTKKRMPVVLLPSQEQAWLTANETAAGKIIAAAQNAPLKAQEAHPKMLALGNTLALRKAPENPQMGLW